MIPFQPVISNRYSRRVELDLQLRRAKIEDAVDSQLRSLIKLKDTRNSLHLTTGARGDVLVMSQGLKEKVGVVVGDQPRDHPG
jgi:hypothetical protein